MKKTTVVMLTALALIIGLLAGRFAGQVKPVESKTYGGQPVVSVIQTVHYNTETMEPWLTYYCCTTADGEAHKIDESLVKAMSIDMALNVDDGLKERVAGNPNATRTMTWTPK
jgi:hypothetical protein